MIWSSLLETLQSVVFDHASPDHLVWKGDRSVKFSVRSFSSIFNNELKSSPS